MSNAMSLKAKIRNIAKRKNIPAQVILQNYMFERLLVRLAASTYKDKFVLKGGMLVAAIVGLDNRATMDLDTTLKNLPLTPETIRSALEQVAAVPFDDGVTFEVGKISPIREDDIYGGYRVMLNAHFDTLITPLSIDVSTGDAITPHAVQYQFSEIFDDEKTYELWAYNIETVMAEKVETILRRGVFNTRPRDFYDAYILATTQKFDKAVFIEALHATADHRGTAEQIIDVPRMLHNIGESPEPRSMWGNTVSSLHTQQTLSMGDHGRSENASGINSGDSDSKTWGVFPLAGANGRNRCKMQVFVNYLTKNGNISRRISHNGRNQTANHC